MDGKIDRSEEWDGITDLVERGKFFRSFRNFLSKKTANSLTSKFLDEFLDLELGVLQLFFKLLFKR